MNQPWGLSGPQFLWVYGAAIAAVFAAPFLVTLLGRTFSAPFRLRLFPRPFSAEYAQLGDPMLDAYEVGYLAGGARRVADVVIGELSASGALRVDSAGRISQADRPRVARCSANRRHGISAAGIPDGLSTDKVRRWLAKDPGIMSISARLRTERLLLPRSWVTAARLTALAAWLALIAVGGLRVAEGAQNHRPTEYLQGLMVVAGYLGLMSILLQRTKQPALTRTRTGSRYLEHLYQQPVRQTALYNIALLGLVAVADPALRAALLTGMPSAHGGSGCGGGGGGGGCGGGCGG